MAEFKPVPKKATQSSDIDHKAKRPLKIGEPLEYRVARLFTTLGYFVRRGRDIYTVGYLDAATDLDVLAIRYTEPFRRETQIVECKSGGDRPLDRVFWLRGVKEYVEADRATLVRQSTRWNIKDFATELGVEIWDLPHIEELEKAAGIDPTIWLGSSDRDFFVAHEAEWNRAIVKDPATKELFLTLAGEVRFHEPFGGINFLLHQLRALTRKLREQRFDSLSLTRFLLAESVAQLAMFLMRVAEASMALSAQDRAGMIQKGLTYGHMDKPFIDRIFRNAERITTEMIKHYTSRDVKLDSAYFTMPEPPHTAEVQAIVQMLIARPAAATTFGPITDLLVYEKFLKQRDGVDWLSKLFRFTDLRDRLALVQEFLKILQQLEAVPEGIFGPNKKTSVTESSTQPTGGMVVADQSLPEQPFNLKVELSAGTEAGTESEANGKKDPPAPTAPLFE